MVAPWFHNVLIWKVCQKIGNLMGSLVVLSGSLGSYFCNAATSASDLIC